MTYSPSAPKIIEMVTEWAQTFTGFCTAFAQLIPSYSPEKMLLGIPKRQLVEAIDNVPCESDEQRQAMVASLFASLWFEEADEVALRSLLKFGDVLLRESWTSRYFPLETRHWHTEVIHNSRLNASVKAKFTSAVHHCVKAWWVNSFAPMSIEYRSQAQLERKSIQCAMGIFLFSLPTDVTDDIARVKTWAKSCLFKFARCLIDELDDQEQNHCSDTKQHEPQIFGDICESLTNDGFGFSYQLEMLCYVLVGLKKAGASRLIIDLVSSFFYLGRNASPTVSRRIECSSMHVNSPALHDVFAFWVEAHVDCGRAHGSVNEVCDQIYRHLDSERHSSAAANRVSHFVSHFEYGHQTVLLRARTELNLTDKPNLVEKFGEAFHSEVEHFSSRMALLRFADRNKSYDQGQEHLDTKASLWINLPTQSIAVLELLDIPNGLPVAILSWRDAKGGIKQETRVGRHAKPGSLRLRAEVPNESKRASAWKRFQTVRPLTDKDIAEFTSKIAQLRCNALAVANSRFAAMIEELFDTAQLELSSTDLILIPRGICSYIPPQLLGRTQTILERVSSVTQFPCFSLLSKTLLRWKISSNCDLGDAMAVGGYFDNAAEYKFFNSLREALPASATFTKTTQYQDAKSLCAKSRLAVFVGHGEPFGVKLADGVFPGVTPLGSPEESMRRSVILCSCSSGDWSSQTDRPDTVASSMELWGRDFSFSPIDEAASLELLMTSETALAATCVGGFTEKVSAPIATNLVRRLLTDLRTESDSPFALARAASNVCRSHGQFALGLVNKESIEQLASENPRRLLDAYFATSFRVCGFF